MDTVLIDFCLPPCPSAAAEVHDALESYESKVVLLNKQLANMAVKLSDNEKQFVSERQTLKEQLKAAEIKIEQLSTDRNDEREKLRVQEYEDTILKLRQKCCELEKDLEESRCVQASSVVKKEEMQWQKEKNELLEQVHFCVI